MIMKPLVCIIYDTPVKMLRTKKCSANICLHDDSKYFILQSLVKALDTQYHFNITVGHNSSFMLKLPASYPRKIVYITERIVLQPSKNLLFIFFCFYYVFLFLCVQYTYR